MSVSIARYISSPLITGKIALAHLKEYPDYYTRLAATAYDHLITRERTAWNLRLEADMDNLRAALTWCRASSTEPGHAQAGLRQIGQSLATAQGCSDISGLHFQYTRDCLEHIGTQKSSQLSLGQPALNALFESPQKPRIRRWHILEAFEHLVGLGLRDQALFDRLIDRILSCVGEILLEGRHADAQLVCQRLPEQLREIGAGGWRGRWTLRQHYGGPCYSGKHKHRDQYPQLHCHAGADCGPAAGHNVGDTHLYRRRRTYPARRDHVRCCPECSRKAGMLVG